MEAGQIKTRRSGHSRCGACGSPLLIDTREVMTVKDDGGKRIVTYYRVHCDQCRAEEKSPGWDEVAALPDTPVTIG